jgi:glycosylphosphatidylinositol transamidase (GPIT) subunit GPI8
VKVTDFFGNVQNVELTKSRYPLVNEEDEDQEESIETNHTTASTTTSTKHLHHSFLVEKKTNTSHWIQTVFGLFSTLAIGFVIKNTL